MARNQSIYGAPSETILRPAPKIDAAVARSITESAQQNKFTIYPGFYDVAVSQINAAVVDKSAQGLDTVTVALYFKDYGHHLTLVEEAICAGLRKFYEARGFTCEFTEARKVPTKEAISLNITISW